MNLAKAVKGKGKAVQGTYPRQCKAPYQGISRHLGKAVPST
jgi:hypothetical protein